MATTRETIRFCATAGLIAMLAARESAAQGPTGTGASSPTGVVSSAAESPERTPRLSLAVHPMSFGPAPRQGSAAVASAFARRAAPLKRTSQRSWLRRHPVLSGTLIGFGAGFLIGYAAGDDGVFDDFTASANGLFVGGIGAAGGAATGLIISLSR